MYYLSMQLAIRKSPVAKEESSRTVGTPTMHQLLIECTDLLSLTKSHFVNTLTKPKTQLLYFSLYFNTVPQVKTHKHYGWNCIIFFLYFVGLSQSIYSKKENS